MILESSEQYEAKCPVISTCMFISGKSNNSTTVPEAEKCQPQIMIKERTTLTVELWKPSVLDFSRVDNLTHFTKNNDISVPNSSIYF